ncbi:Mediator of RNA polymerase II transcription subunit 7 [Modicella reniformis]|uniref:Mediator of RNA polymerase II transcription subunit 7 n=1 Tax=Modicella reniformis TaxID=1440133 RepID=A0A9P6MAR2_9FUNG|nr:Mediator of RNA polymerase II transcription subunit 7 [Modicella reniformis]
MEEASPQQQGTAFPAPPYYYQRYTQENLNLLEKARLNPEKPEIAKSLEALPFPIFALEPPPPVKRGVYWLFGRPWPVHDSLATLEEQGIEQLYPKGPIDRVRELKKLNHSAVFNFLELVHILSTSPSEFAGKVDQIRVIFINMHHILNEYRPHQARETLKLMMEEQLAKKKKETEALRKTCADLRRKLATLKELKQENLPLSSGDTDIEMASAPSTSQGNNTSGSTIATMTTSMISPTGALTSAGFGHDMKALRRRSSGGEQQKALAEIVPMDPVAAREAAVMITILSAVLCLATSTALADKKSTLKPVDNAVGKRADLEGLDVGHGRPLAVIRHDHHIKRQSEHRNKDNDDHDDEDDHDEDDEEEKEVDDGDIEKEEKDHDEVEAGVHKESEARDKDEQSTEDDSEHKQEKDSKNKGAAKKDGDSKDTTVKTPQNESAVDAGEKNGNNNNINVVSPDSTASPSDFTSPIWLVQPFGASVWEQGRDYVISWGPNPDSVYTKALKPKTPVDIRLMQGTPDNLHEIAVLKTGIDSDLHSFKWTVPTTVAPAKDYSIRLTHENQIDTYSHYFEVVKPGDLRSNKSNVGEPLQMPQKSDIPNHANKGPIPKPAAPPNPVPVDSKPTTLNPPATNAPPVAAKPAAHKSGAAVESRQNANMLGFVLTLFGAVYLL